MDSAVKAAYNKGIVVVSAAGNSNIDACTVTPARSPYGITVGATNSDDAKAFFSNWGGCVNIWAPGVDIPSAYFTSDTTYQKLSGTSQATPHVHSPPHTPNRTRRTRTRTRSRLTHAHMCR
jgi:subtilisin family serine protease